MGIIRCTGILCLERSIVPFPNLHFAAPGCSEGLAAQLHDLASAEHFIFMEYHAIEEAEAFGRIKDVLAERAAHGVEVRLFYDDVGSIGFIDPGFIKRMEAIGVECRVCFRS